MHCAASRSDNSLVTPSTEFTAYLNALKKKDTQFDITHLLFTAQCVLHTCGDASSALLRGLMQDMQAASVCCLQGVLLSVVHSASAHVTYVRCKSLSHIAALACAQVHPEPAAAGHHRVLLRV